MALAMQPMNGRTIFAVHETNQWASLRRELGDCYYLQCVDLPKLWLLAIKEVQATARLIRRVDPQPMVRQRGYRSNRPPRLGCK